MKTALRPKIEDRLRTVGLKPTPQRFAVLDYLLRSRIHPTAEQIGADLNRRFPRASRATIYNTLNALCDAGLVHEVHIDNTVARYEANTEPHYHFICRLCQRLEDVRPSAVGLSFRDELEAGYRIDHYEVVMRGICASCNKQRGIFN